MCVKHGLSLEGNKIDRRCVKQSAKTFGPEGYKAIECCAEAWVRAQISPCGISCEQTGTETVFSPSYSVSASQHNSTGVPYSYIIYG